MTNLFLRRKARQRAQAGMTMVELLISMTVLAVGVAGILSMVLLAMAANSRSKNDTTATMLAQLVSEQAQSQPANFAGDLFVNDCAGAAQRIRLASAVAPGAGATLTAAGQMNWAQLPGAVPVGYQMAYTACSANNVVMVYDVRWNITTQYASAGGALTKIVTVSARPAAAQFAGADRLKYFAPPVTLRTVVGR